MKRLAPAVDAPYGIPLNVLIPFVFRPRTLPNVVSTTTSWPATFPVCATTVALPPERKASAPACAATADVCFRKPRRPIRRSECCELISPSSPFRPARDERTRPPTRRAYYGGWWTGGKGSRGELNELLRSSFSSL